MIKAMLCCATAMVATLLLWCNLGTQGVAGLSAPPQSLQGANGSAPLRLPVKNQRVAGDNAFADVAQIFQVASGEPASTAAPRPPATKSIALPYARPDLSSDADERQRAQQVVRAIQRNDFKAAQALVTTQALQELVHLEKRNAAEAVQAEQITAWADKETSRDH